jgi:hypothetical protein
MLFLQKQKLTQAGKDVTHHKGTVTSSAAALTRNMLRVKIHYCTEFVLIKVNKSSMHQPKHQSVVAVAGLAPVLKDASTSYSYSITLTIACQK